MDSKVLSKEQLKELVRFIHSRGFREPVIVLEILDHFACKVEEILAAKPFIHFGQAITEAHKSFGALGFRPIVASFEEATEKRYKVIFWKNFQAVVSTPWSVILLPLIAIGYFKFFMWTVKAQHAHILDVNDGVSVFFLTLIALQLYLYFGQKKEYRRHPFTKVSINAGNFTGIGGLVFYIMTGFTQISYTPFAWIPALIFTAFFTYFIPRVVAALRTIRKAKEDVEAIKQMIIE